MRQKHIAQVSLFDRLAAHEIGREPEAMSNLLDTQPGLLDEVANDLGSDAGTGRHGMRAESVLPPRSSGTGS